MQLGQPQPDFANRTETSVGRVIRHIMSGMRHCWLLFVVYLVCVIIVDRKCSLVLRLKRNMSFSIPIYGVVNLGHFSFTDRLNSG